MRTLASSAVNPFPDNILSDSKARIQLRKALAKALNILRDSEYHVDGFGGIDKTLGKRRYSLGKSILTETRQFSNTPEQIKCAVYVPTAELPLDLQLVCNAWSNLPKTTRTKIIQLVLEVLE